MINVKNLTQKYGKKVVLDELNVKIEKNKITSLIGANGAGKSTLFSVISNLIKPVNGEIILQGKCIKKYSTTEIAKEISVLRQNNNINIRITVEELVSFGRFPHSQGNLGPEDYEKVNDAISYLNLEEIRDSYINELSGGQRQRAFIAMILAQDTKCILLDEPLNNLDMRYAEEMMIILNKLARELKKTIVIVMHDINCAAHYSDRIIALKDGKIIKDGTSDEVITKEVLDVVYDHDFKIEEFYGKKICLYNNVS